MAEQGATVLALAPAWTGAFAPIHPLALLAMEIVTVTHNVLDLFSVAGITARILTKQHKTWQIAVLVKYLVFVFPFIYYLLSYKLLLLELVHSPTGHIALTMFVPLAKEIVIRIQSVQDLLFVGLTTAEIFIQMHIFQLIVVWVIKLVSLSCEADIICFCAERTSAGTGTSSDWSFCSVSSPCSIGQGDCDSDAECSNSLKCGKDNCRDFNPSAIQVADCCVESGEQS